MLRTISIILLTTIHGLPAWADDCAEWKTPAFFVTASPDEIIACLQVDSKIDARNKRGLTPLHMASANSRSYTHNQDSQINRAVIHFLQHRRRVWHVSI